LTHETSAAAVSVTVHRWLATVFKSKYVTFASFKSYQVWLLHGQWSSHAA